MKILIAAVISILITLIIIILNLYMNINYLLNDNSDRSSASDPTKKLITVHLLFRHGARTPVGSYPTDPHINETYYPVGFGQLTKSGRKQMYEIGKWIRRRYHKFLGNVYDFEATYVQTTNLYRTKMSMEALLAGLFPPHNTPMEWDDKLNWQPIPMYSKELEEDHLLWVQSICSRYYEAWSEVIKSPVIQADIHEREQLISELTELTGFKFKSPYDIFMIYSILESQEEFGLKLPKWTKKYYPDRLRPICERSYLYTIWTEEMRRLKGGPFIKELIQNWREKIGNTIQPIKRNFFIYGAHDLTVISALAALDVWQQQYPSFGIMAIFELLQDRTTGEYGVQIYQKKPGDNIQSLTIPGCESFCPFERFIELTKHITPINMTLECIPKDPNFKSPTIPKTL